mgnify:CR=1 FL=1|jgi:hypothetical protein
MPPTLFKYDFTGTGETYQILLTFPQDTVDNMPFLRIWVFSKCKPAYRAYRNRDDRSQCHDKLLIDIPTFAPLGYSSDDIPMNGPTVMYITEVPN